MTDLRNQRRMAAQVLGVGETRVWIDPLHADEVATAVTRQDIRGMVDKGLVRKVQAQGVSRGRARALATSKSEGRRRGPGSRQGSLTSRARDPRKARWIRTIRPLRQTLHLMRDEELIDTPTYRRFYRRAKGGVFRSRPHLLSHMVTEGLLTEEQARDVRQRAEALRAASFGKPAPGTERKPPAPKAKPKPKVTRAEREERKARRAAKREAKAKKETAEQEPEAKAEGKAETKPEAPSRESSPSPPREPPGGEP